MKINIKISYYIPRKGALKAKAICVTQGTGSDAGRKRQRSHLFCNRICGSALHARVIGESNRDLYKGFYRDLYRDLYNNYV